MKVLLVDLDTQGHAGKSLGLDVRSLEPNAFHWLSEPSMPFSEVIRPCAIDNLTVIPSYKQMSEFATRVAADPRGRYRLADRLAEPEAAGFDAVVIDSPPSMGLTTFNILVASTEVVVPVALTYLALDGCAEVVETVNRVAREHSRPELRVTRVVPTLYRKTALADEILARLRAHFPDRCARTLLSLNVKIDEAQSHGKTIWEYAPRSRGAALLTEISEEIFEAGRTPAATAGPARVA